MTGDLSGFLAFGAALFLAVSHPPPPAGLRWWHRRWLFVLLLAATLGFFQRDAILANFQLWNPDESEMLAGALKLRHHPIFWRDVDGATHGPLNQFPLVLPALLGLRIDYLAAHLIGTAILVLTLYCLHRALAEWVSEGVARLCVLPGWAFFIFTREPEIVQYTTEMPSCLILAAAGWFGSRVWRTGAGVSAADLFRAGLLCGAAPFAKLQSTPMAAWVFGVAAFHLLRAPDRSGAARVRNLGWLTGAALLPGFCFVGLAAWHGAFRYFIVAYFESNLVGYVFQARAFFNAAYPKLEYVFGLAQFVWPVVGAIGLGLLVTGWKRHAPPWRTLAYAAGLAGVSLFAVFAPHKPFGHYFLFLIGPLLLLLGTTAGPLLAPLRIAARAGFVLALVTPLAVHHVRHPNYFPAVLNQRTRVPPELVAALQRLTQPDDFMAVWGWRPALYVYTQTMPSARNLNTYWPAVDSPRRDFYRATYLADLKLHPPVVFVDTVGPADFFFKTRVESVNHESFPALDAYVRENYVLVETLSGARVYLRKDRADPPPAKL